MPVGKRPQSNTMLYPLIIFVALFLVTTALAIIFYIKAEGQKTQAAALQKQVNDLATASERRQIGTLVGAKQGRKSRIATMIDYLDQMVAAIIGGVPENTSAEAKLETVNRKTKETFELLTEKNTDIGVIDSNTTGLIRIIEKLQTTLDNARNSELAANQQFEDLQKRFDDATAINFEKEQTLLAEKEKYQKQVNDIQQDYEELKALVRKTAEQQVQALITQIDNEKENRRALNKKLLKTQAELKNANDKLSSIQTELQKLVPPPDSEVAAFKPDGKIILIDERNKIVHINIGSDDHIYRGLPFSVYEKNVPIPKSGKGKAEIEIFNVGQKVSAAKIISSEPKTTILLDDAVANLIWDKEVVNTFVIAGDFDLDNDGSLDPAAAEKINILIEKWGGLVADSVSINTDFLILGQAPKIRQKPTFEEMEVDPTAMEKYDRSLQKLSRYKQVQKQAKDLGIPIFNYERFLYFIGYKSLSIKPGAF